ncbi:MAG: hypothetical protein WKF92_05320 [Pyrinomonadaceae bacterium]
MVGKGEEAGRGTGIDQSSRKGRVLFSQAAIRIAAGLGRVEGERDQAGRFVVTRVMREEGLKAKYLRAFRPRTTDSRHNKTLSPNLLKDISDAVFGAGENRFLQRAGFGSLFYSEVVLARCFAGLVCFSKTATAYVAPAGFV